MAVQNRHLDTFDFLESDHNNISNIFDLIKSSTAAERENLILELSDQIDDHLTLEEDFVYPVLEDYKELQDAIVASVGEHEEIRHLIEDVVELETGSPQWHQSFTALQEAKADHMAMEHQEIFPRARQLLGPEGVSHLDELVARGRGLPLSPPYPRKRPGGPHLVP
jgi:iron-sulfur cluster repair protein YtfE (RIC family)